MVLEREWKRTAESLFAWQPFSLKIGSTFSTPFLERDVPRLEPRSTTWFLAFRAGENHLVARPQVYFPDEEARHERVLAIDIPRDEAVIIVLEPILDDACRYSRVICLTTVQEYLGNIIHAITRVVRDLVSRETHGKPPMHREKPVLARFGSLLDEFMKQLRTLYVLFV